MATVHGVYKDAARSVNQEVKEIASGVEDAICGFDLRWGAWSGGRLVVFLGDTGVGKTTLIHLVANSQLRYEFDDMYGVSRITVVEGGDKIPEAVISSKKGSETSVPNQLLMGPEGAAYADCPGLQDTGQALAQVRNAVMIQKLFEKALEVKLVVVIAYRDLVGRATPLLTTACDIQNMFLEKMNELGLCVSLVISMADPEFTADHAREHIKAILKEVPAAEAYRPFLEGLSKRITVFPISVPPQRDPSIELGKVRETLLKNFERCAWEGSLSVSPSVSAGSKVHLMESHRHLRESLEEYTGNFIGGLRAGIETFIAPCFDKNPAGLSEESRERIKGQLKEGILATEELVKNVGGGVAWKDADFEKLIDVCQSVAKCCGLNSSAADIEIITQRLPSLQYLERFIPDQTGNLRRMIQQFVQEVIACRFRMEQACITIDKTNAEERAAETERLRVKQEEVNKALSETVRATELLVKKQQEERAALEAQRARIIQAQQNARRRSKCVIS